MSNKQNALDLLNNVIGHIGQVAWKIDPNDVILRLIELVQDPSKFEQKNLNVCGPAIFYRIWFARDPLGAATFGYRLLKSGNADIGPITIIPSSALLAQDYAILYSLHTSDLPRSADWMLASALRDSENSLIDYIGEPGTLRDSVAGMTPPITLYSWLKATNQYQKIEIRPPEHFPLISHISNLNADVALLVFNRINLSESSAPIGTPPPFEWFGFPNHYILLLEQIRLSEDQQWLQINYWTWAANRSGWWGRDRTEKFYFGSVVALV